MSDTLTKIREKYPAYASTSDDQLVEAIGRKYPQYLQSDQGFKDEFDQVTMSGEREALAASEKQADFLAGQTEAARTGSYWEGVAQRADKLLKYVVEPSTRPVSGTLGRALDVVIPGAPVAEPVLQQSGIHLPKAGEAETTGGQIAAGTYNAVVDLVGALSSPDMVVQFPAAANRAVLTTWMAQIAGHQPERAIRAAELFKEGKKQEAIQEVAMGVGEVTMAGLGTRYLIKTMPEAVVQPAIIAPRTTEAVRLTEAQLEGKTIEILPEAKVEPVRDATGLTEAEKTAIQAEIEPVTEGGVKPETQIQKEGQVLLGGELPNDITTLRKLKQDVESRVDELTENSKAKVKGTALEGQAGFGDIRQSLDVLTDINTKISELEKTQPAVAPAAADPSAPRTDVDIARDLLRTEGRIGTEKLQRLAKLPIKRAEAALNELEANNEIVRGKSGQWLPNTLAPKAAPVAAEPSFADALKTYQETPVSELAKNKQGPVGGATGKAFELGSMAKTAEDVAALRTMAEESASKTKALMEEGKLEEAMQEAGRQPAEAYEFATGVKLDGTPKWDMFEKRIPGYKPPVPDAKYLEAHPEAVVKSAPLLDVLPPERARPQTALERQIMDAEGAVWSLAGLPRAGFLDALRFKAKQKGWTDEQYLSELESVIEKGTRGSALDISKLVPKSEQIGSPSVSGAPLDRATVAKIAYELVEGRNGPDYPLSSIMVPDVRRAVAKKYSITENTIQGIERIILGQLEKQRTGPSENLLSNAVKQKEVIRQIQDGFAEDQVKALSATEPSGPRIGIIPEGTELAMETVGNPGWWRRNFTAQKGLPEGVPEAWLKRMGEVRAETRGATYAARDLATALRSQFNIGTRKFALRGLSDVPKPVMESIQRVLTGGADISTLAEPLREPVRKIREHVDTLSQEMMDVMGPDSPMSATIGENLGVYLTRSYRIFDNPKWVKKIPVDVRNRAEAFLADSGLTAEQAKIRLNEMLADWSEQGLDKLMRSGKLGAKDISLFMQRKDIALEIRAVMGEYGDPITNYIRSITKMSRWIGDQEFLNKAKELGMGNWLFEEGQARPPGFDQKLAADSSQTMFPLNGLRTSKEIKTLFETMDKGRPSDNFFARVYFAVNAWSRQAKTVFSALTQARNFIGNPFFNLKSGHINFKDYGPAFKAQWADIAGSDKTAQAFYKEMARYGLVDENVVVSDLRAAMKDAGLQDPSFEDYSMRGAARALRLAIEAPQRAYRLPDEMGKTVGWLAEQKDLQAAHPEWTEVQVKEAAAARVRNEYPTYSMIPEWLQQFRKQPFVGPFVNFAYETMRTSYWTLRNGSTDLFTEGNARQKANGAKKLAGFGLTVGASGAILNEIGQMAFGIPDDTEDDVRRFLPFYSKNAQLIPLGKDGTKLRYLNYSYVNPYSVFNDAWVAAIQNSDKGIFDASLKSFGELIRPFSNEQMLFGGVEQAIRNQDAFGNQIYNPLDSTETKMSKAALHMSKAVLPGTLERFQKRILPALTGEKTKSGQELNPVLEVASEFTGLRMDETDMLKQFSFKMREFQENEDVNARKLATSVLFNPNKPTFENALAAYRLGDDARFKIWQELYKDVNALLRQGASMDQIEDSMKAGKMSKKDINSVISGEYIPLSVTDKDYRNVNIESDDKVLDAIQDEYDQRLGKKL